MKVTNAAKRPKSGSVNKSTEFSTMIGGHQLLATQIKGMMNSLATESAKRRQLTQTAQNDKKGGFTGSTKLLTLSRKDYELWGTSKRSRISPHPQSDKKSKSLSFVNQSKPQESILRSLVKKAQIAPIQRPNSLTNKAPSAIITSKHPQKPIPSIQKSTLSRLSQILFSKSISKATTKQQVGGVQNKTSEARERSEVVVVTKPKPKPKPRPTKKASKATVTKKPNLPHLWINTPGFLPIGGINSQPSTATAKDLQQPRYFISPGLWSLGNQAMPSQTQQPASAKDRVPNTTSARSLLGAGMEETALVIGSQTNGPATTTTGHAQVTSKTTPNPCSGDSNPPTPVLARLILPLFKKLQGDKPSSRLTGRTSQVMGSSYEQLAAEKHDRQQDGVFKGRNASKPKALLGSSISPALQNSTASQSSSAVGSTLIYPGAFAIHPKP